MKIAHGNTAGRFEDHQNRRRNTPLSPPQKYGYGAESRMSMTSPAVLARINRSRFFSLFMT